MNLQSSDKLQKKQKKAASQLCRPQSVCQSSSVHLEKNKQVLSSCCQHGLGLQSYICKIPQDSWNNVLWTDEPKEMFRHNAQHSGGGLRIRAHFAASQA